MSKLPCGATITFKPEHSAKTAEQDTFKVTAFDPNDDFRIGNSAKELDEYKDGKRGPYGCFYLRRSSIPAIIRQLNKLYRSPKLWRWVEDDNEPPNK